MGFLSALARPFTATRAAKRLVREARACSDLDQRERLLAEAIPLAGWTWTPDPQELRYELAVTRVALGRVDDAAEAWRQALETNPFALPTREQLAALAPVLPLVAADVVRALSRPNAVLDHHWRLERGWEGRWRVETGRYRTAADALPVLRLLASAHALAEGPRPGQMELEVYEATSVGDATGTPTAVVLEWDVTGQLTNEKVRGDA